MACRRCTSDRVHSVAKLQSRVAGRLALVASPALFALVGVSNTAVDVAVFWVLTEQAHVAPLLANAASYSIGALNSFALNKLITFRDRESRDGSARQMAAFALVKLASLGLSSLVLALALPLAPSLAAKLISIVVTFSFAYALTSRLVFR